MHNLLSRYLTYFFFILILTACDTKTCIESSQIPPAVQKGFASIYSGFTPCWESKPYGYEGVFINKSREYEAEFSRDGRWLETEYQVSDKEFSGAVLRRVQQEHPGYQITKKEIEITPQGIFYEVEIASSGEKFELYFDAYANPTSNLYEDS